MKKKITICSAQFGDLPLEELCRLMHGIGYEGLELACQSHIDVDKIVSSASYREEFQTILNKYDMKIGAISAHLMGQCIGDRYDSRLDNFAPNKYAGKPDEIRKWAIEGMKTAAHAAQILGGWFTCFWVATLVHSWYSYPQTNRRKLLGLENPVKRNGRNF